MSFKQAWKDDSEIFRSRRAAPARRFQRLLLGVLLFVGLLCVIRFVLWWFQPRHVHNLPLYALLSLATWYGTSRIVVGWYNYFHIEQPRHIPAPAGLSVAIFTTSSPGEPLAMFERTLAAAREIRYPHNTYLLDDTGDPRYGELAERMGAMHLELKGFPGAKAGKINAALKRTTEEYVLVLDPDHIPLPEFLDRVLGHFADPRVGFVQVSQAYHNVPASFVSRAAAEQTFAFYGPIMQGMNGTNTAVAIGANCTFRRSALESIGGHGIGLAEDLVTSIRLHAAGWHSVYIPEIVSRGLVPEDLDSYLRQQLKWARGVYDVLFHEYPRAFSRLSAHQKISYWMIGTYYLVGLTTPVYLGIPLLYLWSGVQPAAMFMADYIVEALPVAVFGIAAYLFVQLWMCDPVRERGLHWRGTLLKIGCWSVFVKGLVLGAVGIAVPYIPTPKERRAGSFLRLAAVPLAVTLLSAVTGVVAVCRRLYATGEGEVRITTEVTYGMLAFLLLNCVFMSGRIFAAWRSRRI